MNFGLSAKEIEILKNVFAKTPDLEAVYIYGPRTEDGAKKMPELDLAVRFKAEVDEAGHLAAVINDLFRGYTVSVLDEDTVKQSRFKDIYENTRAEFWKNKNISRQKSGFNQKLPSMDVISKIIKIATADIKKQALKMIKDEDAKKIEQIKAEIMATKK